MPVQPEAARRERIEAALAAVDGGERIALPWRDGRSLFDVVEIPLESVLLNPRSHRIRADLESHPNAELVNTDPFSEESQLIITDIIENQEGFDQLLWNLGEEHQREAGAVTRTGLLVNANRRAVALRRIGRDHFISAAVLPADAGEREIDELELRLQMQEDFRRDYTFTNELLFVFDLTNSHNLTPEVVARELRWAASSDAREVRKGVERVQRYLRILGLIRDVQAMCNRKLKLTTFDNKQQSLLELDAALQDLQGQEREARRLRDTRLIGMLVGLGYDKLRSMDEDFVDDYLEAPLREHEFLGVSADELLRSPELATQEDPMGLDVLTGAGDDSESDIADPAPILEIVTTAIKDGRVRLPGTDTVPDRDVLEEWLSQLMSGAADQAKEDRAHNNDTTAPLKYLESAIQKIAKADDRLDRAAGLEGFDLGKMKYLAKRAAQQSEALRNRVDNLVH